MFSNHPLWFESLNAVAIDDSNTLDRRDASLTPLKLSIALGTSLVARNCLSVMLSKFLITLNPNCLKVVTI